MELPRPSIKNNLSVTNKDSCWHPLKSNWVLWAHLPNEKEWRSIKGYKRLATFSTIEDAITVTCMLSEELVKNCMFFIMREGINPMWEDPKNRNGGAFSYRIGDKLVYNVWKQLTYALTGESIFINPLMQQSVTGITISPKKKFCIVKIWMTSNTYQNPADVTTLISGMVPGGCLFKKHSPEY